MLKIEDLEVGDELEFVNEDAMEEFYNMCVANRYITTEFNTTNKVISVGEYMVDMEGSLPYGNCLEDVELKYFRKVETKKGVVDTPEVESTYVNAGIKSYEESYTRMMKGEVFYFKGSYVYYDKGYGNFKFGDKLLGPYKSEYEHFEVKKPWYEFASEGNPILCKVWGCDIADYSFEEVSAWSEEDQAFIGEEFSWDNATPVKPSECFQG